MKFNFEFDKHQINDSVQIFLLNLLGKLCMFSQYNILDPTRIIPSIGRIF